MQILPPILAEFEDAFKVIVGVIVFIIWGIGALANLAKKQNRPSQHSESEMERAMRAQIEEARRREAAQALGQMGGQPTYPLPPPPILPPQQQPPMRPRQRGPAVPPMRNLPQVPPPRAVRGPAPMVPPPIRRPDPLMQPGRAQPKRQQPKKQQAQQRRRAPQVPQAQLVLSELDEIAPSFAGQSGSEPPGLRGEIGSTPARRQAAAAPVLRLTAQGLRHQFILTEILQPPLALREHPPGA